MSVPTGSRDDGRKDVGLARLRFKFADALAALCGNGCFVAGDAHRSRGENAAGFSVFGADGCPCKSPLLPGEVNLETAACTESSHVAGGPRIGPCRQQLKRSGMGLKQHFRNAGCAAEVTIDLEGSEMVDSVGIGVIIAAHNTLNQAGRKLKVINVNKDVYGLFTTMRLNRRFTVEGV